jgi:hypothetical protein
MNRLIRRYNHLERLMQNLHVKTRVEGQRMSAPARLYIDVLDFNGDIVISQLFYRSSMSTCLLIEDCIHRLGMAKIQEITAADQLGKSNLCYTEALKAALKKTGTWRAIPEPN